MARRRALRSVALPTEHGGWSFTLEPPVLGLLVAWSGAGTAIGAAALLAFLCRTPLKVALVDRRRGRRLPRTVLAERVVAVEALAILTLVATAVAAAGPAFVVPLAVGAPLVAVELWYDARSRSRRLVPELAGTVALGSVAMSVAVAGGESWSVAAGLWLVIAARDVATVPFVRLQLRRAKEQPWRRWPSDAAQGVAVAAVGVGVAVGPVPLAAVAAIAVLAAYQLVAARVTVPEVAVIGATQVALGLGVVLATGLGVLGP